MTSAAPGTGPTTAATTMNAATGATPIAGEPGLEGGVAGTTEVLPSVVQKITAFAVREIPGVVALGGGGAARAVGAMRQTLTGSTENTAGVRVELEEQKARIAVDVEIEYGVGAHELVRAVRRHVPKAVEEIAGVPVVELDIVITDVHLPGPDVDQARAGS